MTDVGAEAAYLREVPPGGGREDRETELALVGAVITDVLSWPETGLEPENLYSDRLRTVVRAWRDACWRSAALRGQDPRLALAALLSESDSAYGKGPFNWHELVARLVGCACQSKSDAVAAAERVGRAAAERAEHHARARRELEPGEPGRAKPSQADLLVEIGLGAELWHDADHEAFATFRVGGQRQTHKLRTRLFRRWLVREFYDAHDKAPGGQAVTNALDVLEGQAMFDGLEREAFLRVAHHGGRIYLDLADDSWTVVEIDSRGWRVCESPPVRFRRAQGMRPLPLPVRGGELSALRELVNVPDDRDWTLVLGWLVGLFSRGPYVALVVQGEPGAAKTTLSRMLRRLVDPSKVDLRSAPRNDERDLAVAAGNGWVIGYDNLSGLPGWLSDALCRVATGGGFGTRKLYSDDEETLFDFTRPILINGIDAVVGQPDLVERSSTLRLPRIPESARQDERELWDRFDHERPRLLGALLDAVACALGRRDQVQLDTRPRMADAATWVEAAAPALGLEPGEYVAALGGNQSDAVSAALDGDVVGSVLKAFVEANGGWYGTAAQLLSELERRTPGRPDGWPKTARALSSRLSWLTPALRAEGINMERTRGPSPKRERILQFTLASDPDRPGGRSSGTCNSMPGSAGTQVDGASTGAGYSTPRGGAV